MDSYASRIVTRLNDDYPRRLLDLSDAPERIFVRGTLPDHGARTVAIIGSRCASEAGRKLATRLALHLSRRDVVVVSGGALGIDIAAHQGAVRAQAPTVVVLPSPVDRPAPRTNRGIFRTVLQQGGALISEIEVQRGKWDFCARNRLIAALAELTVVVEAGQRSGTRYTVDAARGLHRALGAFPWAVGDLRGIGCLEILRQGGKPIADVTDVFAILDAVSGGSAFRSDGLPSKPPAPIKGGIEGQILELLSRGPMTYDQLARHLKVPVWEVMPRVASLELEGLLEGNGGGRIQLPL